MDVQPNKLVSKFEETKSDTPKKRFVKKSNTSTANTNLNNSSQNAIMNLRAPITSSMLVSSVQAPQSSMSISHNLVTHSIAPVKIHTNTTYPLQLSTVTVPVQIPGSTSNINVPVQLSGPASSVPLLGPTVSLPIQVSATSTMPVQLQNETLNVPMQMTNPANIQLTGTPMSSMPILQNPNQQMHSSIIHLHMGNTRTSVDGQSQTENQSYAHIGDKNTSTAQMSNTSQINSNPIQLSLPNAGAQGTVQLRGGRVPHVVYIQTPSGLKPVANSDLMTQASSSGNPPQIIVRRPISSAANIHVISNANNKTNIGPKLTSQNKALVTGGTAQTIVIQKPKGNEKVILPVANSSSSTPGKSAVAYLGSVKKGNSNKTENQSILLSNNQPTSNNQKLFLTPMNMPKIQNTKFILPVSLPATMASKGPIINLQIANGQIQQNDAQGITVMRDTGNIDSDMPPLQPLKMFNGKDKSKPYAVSITGSRAESTGEQEYTLSIPETNASMNDDVYTVSIANDEDGSKEKSFTLPIPEKGKSLLNRNDFDTAVPASAILRRSNSETCERTVSNAALKRRVSLCNENLIQSKSMKLQKSESEDESNEDNRVPSLFCDEKMDKDLELKENLGDSDTDKEYSFKENSFQANLRSKRGSMESISEEDPPGLQWSNGVAVLQGSSLQFQTNEFGLIDLIESGDCEEPYLNHASKYNTPLKQRINSAVRGKKATSPEDLYRCDGCGCHGMAADFVTPNFCSLTCQNEDQKAIHKKRERENAEMMRKRNRMKRLLRQEAEVPQPRNDNYNMNIENRLVEPAKVDDDNSKYPWMCGKNGFSWMRYLDFCKAKAAQVKLFKDPFPYTRNQFRVGMRMEAIDPQNPSIFCVVSVAEVQGFRMRLHFDQYPDVYDYWVNADSIDIFPPGYCEKYGRTLKPPFSYTSSNFSWPMYLKQQRAVAAPRHIFPHLRDNMVKPSGFRIGMKLEAEDRKNRLVCVATITDMMDNRMLVNFDSWDEMYDFWADPTSPYIHPVGWAEENGVALTPPNFYKDPDSFTWESYLMETNSSAAPARAFKTRPPQGFKVGMKMEVVDKKVPFLIRCATVSEVKGHQILISFDGWPKEHSYWLDDNSPDIHPVGWCLKTGHPLEPPLTSEEGLMAGPCGVLGCRGLGSVKGSEKQHADAVLCPYRNQSPPPRLSLHTPEHKEPKNKRVLSRLSRPSKSAQSNSGSIDVPKEKLPRGRPPKFKKVEEIKTEPASDEDSLASSTKRYANRPTTQDIEESVLKEYQPRVVSTEINPKLKIEHHINDLALPSKATKWTEGHVTAFVTRIAGVSAGEAVSAARLSGLELMISSREELVDCAQMRLGPAIKVYAAIKHLRETLT